MVILNCKNIESELYKDNNQTILKLKSSISEIFRNNSIDIKCKFYEDKGSHKLNIPIVDINTDSNYYNLLQKQICNKMNTSKETTDTYVGSENTCDSNEDVITIDDSPSIIYYQKDQLSQKVQTQSNFDISEVVDSSTEDECNKKTEISVINHAKLVYSSPRCNNNYQDSIVDKQNEITTNESKNGHKVFIIRDDTNEIPSYRHSSLLNNQYETSSLGYHGYKSSETMKMLENDTCMRTLNVDNNSDRITVSEKNYVTSRNNVTYPNDVSTLHNANYYQYSSKEPLVHPQSRLPSHIDNYHKREFYNNRQHHSVVRNIPQSSDIHVSNEYRNFDKRITRDSVSDLTIQNKNYHPDNHFISPHYNTYLHNRRLPTQQMYERDNKRGYVVKASVSSGRQNIGTGHSLSSQYDEADIRLRSQSMRVYGRQQQNTTTCTTSGPETLVTWCHNKVSASTRYQSDRYSIHMCPYNDNAPPKLEPITYESQLQTFCEGNESPPNLQPVFYNTKYDTALSEDNNFPPPILEPYNNNNNIKNNNENNDIYSCETENISEHENQVERIQDETDNTNYETITESTLDNSNDELSMNIEDEDEAYDTDEDIDVGDSYDPDPDLLTELTIEGDEDHFFVDEEDTVTSESERSRPDLNENSLPGSHVRSSSSTEIESNTMCLDYNTEENTMDDVSHSNKNVMKVNRENAEQPRVIIVETNRATQQNNMDTNHERNTPFFDNDYLNNEKERHSPPIVEELNTNKNEDINNDRQDSNNLYNYKDLSNTSETNSRIVFQDTNNTEELTEQFSGVKDDNQKPCKSRGIYRELGMRNDAELEEEFSVLCNGGAGDIKVPEKMMYLIDEINSEGVFVKDENTESDTLFNLPDTALRCRMLVVLWVLLGEARLEEVGFPHEPVHKILWRTVDVCCSVAGVKSASAVPLPPDHDCGTDMTCFRDHAHRFLEVCAPTREHWKRFGWASLTVDAVVRKMYIGEILPMMQLSRSVEMPDAVRRAIALLKALEAACMEQRSVGGRFILPKVQATNRTEGEPRIHGDQPSVVKKKRGRPAKVTHKSDVGRVERVMLWRFLLNLLEEPLNTPCIHWVRREEGIFRIINTDWLARLWGRRHGNPRMTYEKMARAMRTYYRSKVLQPVPRSPNLPRKLVYKFNPAVIQKVAAAKLAAANALNGRNMNHDATTAYTKTQGSAN